MRHIVPIAAFLALVAGCSPAGVNSPSGSPSPGPSAPAQVPGAPAVPVATPTAIPTAVPITVKMTIDGKPATIEPLAYLLPVTITSNTSFFWNVGTFAKSGESNIGQGYGLLKEGEGNVTLHMKYAESTGAAALRTMTDAEFKSGFGMTYKEGPRCLTWHANSQNFSTGSFTVEGGVVTYKVTATIAGDKKGNDGTTRKFDIELVGLPRP